MESENFSLTEKIEREVLIVGAIALENEEIKDNETMLAHTLQYDSEGVSLPPNPLVLNPDECLNFNGLAMNSDQYAPLMLLVPHLRSQQGMKSVSFVQILNLANKLQVVSYFKRRETVMEY